METIVHIGGRKRIASQEVVLLLAEQNYTRIFFRNGMVLMVATTLKTLEERFKVAGSFFRPNRTAMLNMQFMSACNNHTITINNNQTFKISRRRQSGFTNFQHSFHQKSILS